ncbi:MAG: hypothetical protein F6J93_35885 [Oscillatoria sp. SIO1A7]|nr:hypothetical protein [Oscillatoria sp. SIO1A7]
MNGVKPNYTNLCVGFHSVQPNLHLLNSIAVSSQRSAVSGRSVVFMEQRKWT